MFKNRALQFAIAYTLLVIIYKVAIVISGHALSRFNFLFSNILSVLIIIPFIFLTIKYTRQDKGGYIAGNEALKKGLLMAVISALILGIYNYIEFEWVWRDLSVDYYHSNEFKLFLEKNKQIKVEEYPAKINAAISEISAMKAVTGKLATLMFISIGASFMCAVFLKRNKPAFSEN
jgi:hypothetical protein